MASSPEAADATTGAIKHTYIPRSDGAYVIGGIPYYLQAGGALGTTPVAVVTPVTVAAPAPVAVSASPVVIPTAYAPPPQPVVYQQPQSAYYAPHQQPFVAQPYGITPQSIVNGIPSFNVTQPTFGTVGYTGYETLTNQMAFAQNSNVNEKQEMKPADDDPLRMYWVREEDGSWTQRNRLTIDSGDIGECRWYAMDGKFYAVRLPQ